MLPQPRGLAPVPRAVERLTVSVDDEMIEVARKGTFTLHGQACSLPVVGVFEIRGGKVAVWREYYDNGVMAAALAD